MWLPHPLQMPIAEFIMIHNSFPLFSIQYNVTLVDVDIICMYNTLSLEICYYSSSPIYSMMQPILNDAGHRVMQLSNRNVLKQHNLYNLYTLHLVFGELWTQTQLSSLCLELQICKVFRIWIKQESTANTILHYDIHHDCYTPN